MAKNVALADDVYTLLERMKRHDESFSDVIRRLNKTTSKPDWRDSFGVWKNDNEIGDIFDKILKERHIIRKRRELRW